MCYFLILLLEDNFQSFSIICFVFVLYSVFNEHIVDLKSTGGLKWTRTTDLTLIRRAL